MNTTARQTYDSYAHYWIGDEDVNGVIVGGDTHTYQFWHKVTRLFDGAIVDEPITRKMEFDSDADAVAWFKMTHPESHAAGAEMRVYN
jgi:hypothetical protein